MPLKQITSMSRTQIPEYDFQNPSGNSFPFEIKRIETAIDGKGRHVFSSNTPSHRHNFYEIIWIQEGKGKYQVDFVWYPIRNGCLFFLSPGQVHFWNVTSPPNGYVILFTDEFLVRAGMEKKMLMELPYFQPLNAVPFVVVSKHHRGDVVEAIKKIDAEYRTAQSYCDVMLGSYLNILFTLARRMYNTKNISRVVSPGDVLIRKFKSLIEEHFLSKRFVSEYAEVLFVTPNHLNDTSNKILGRSASELIRERVLLEAKRLLVHSEASAAEVSYQLDFDDPSYFGRFFRKHAGCSPGEFRKRYQSLALLGQ
jgi:AraC family transcriptional activator of pobA